MGLRSNMTPKKIRTGDDTPEDTEPWTGDQWRYATVAAQTSSETLLNRLNEMGQRGWEAVNQGHGRRDDDCPDEAEGRLSRYA